MKVLLINPNAHDVGLLNRWKYFEGLNIPLGLCYIASQLKRHNIEVAILDCYAQRASLNETVENITLASPTVVGLSCTTPSFDVVNQIAKTIKNVIGDIPIVVGGCHPTVSPDEMLNLPYFDYVIRGEGEETMVDLIRYLKGEIDIKTICGLSYKRDGKIIHNAYRKPIEDLDSLGYPALDLLDLSLYRDLPHEEITKPSFPILGSRGCVFSCSFCSREFLGKGRRCRSVRHIVSEIQYLVERYNARQISFVDPISPVSEEEGLEFCNEIERAGLEKKILWLCETHVKCVTKRLLTRMKESGCRKILFGIESGNEKILKDIGKGYTQRDVINAVKMTNHAGIETIGLFIIGFPGETKDMVEETIRFSKSLGLRYAIYNRLVPYPGTRIYNSIKTQNNVGAISDNWSEYVPYSFLVDSKSAYTPNGVSDEELRLLQKRAYFEFYYRPSILLQELRKKNFRKKVREMAKAFWKLSRWGIHKNLQLPGRCCF